MMEEILVCSNKFCPNSDPETARRRQGFIRGVSCKGCGIMYCSTKCKQVIFTKNIFY